MPADVVEDAGRGVTATVEGRCVTVGSRVLLPDGPQWATATQTRAVFDGAVIAWVTVDENLVGAIIFIDRCANTPRGRSAGCGSPASRVW